MRQKNVSCVFDIPSQKAIDNYLNKVLGLKKEDNYFYGNDYFSVTDVSNLSDNVLSGEDGHLYFIDPIIKLKKPALEVLDFLYENGGDDFKSLVNMFSSTKDDKGFAEVVNKISHFISSGVVHLLREVIAE